MDCANFCFKHRQRGTIYGYFSDVGLRSLMLPHHGAPRVHLLHSAPNVVWGHRLGEMLVRYFAGVKVDFSGIPVDYGKATSFQIRVWEALRAIPWGETGTYGELAARAGSPRGARAVGQALGANPVPIIVPCHRILAAGSRIGGFGAGLGWKRELLRLEGIAVR